MIARFKELKSRMRSRPILRGLLFCLALMVGCARPPPAPLVGGPFVMVDVSGKRVDQRILQGKWSAVYFGYTFCPDVCPTTLTALGRAQAALGAQAGKFQVVFASVDPARDTPAQMRTYLTSPAFPKRTIGLTGTPQEALAMEKAYHVYVQRQGSGPDYSVDHTSVVYLMNPKGEFDRPLDPTAAPPALAAQIAAAMKAG
jgi:protein SCO1/2